MSDLIEAVARAMKPEAFDLSPDQTTALQHEYWHVQREVARRYARAAIAAIEAAGYNLVLRQHRDMGPGFTHHDGTDCPCFAAAPKVTE